MFTVKGYYSIFNPTPLGHVTLFKAAAAFVLTPPQLETKYVDLGLKGLQNETVCLHHVFIVLFLQSRFIFDPVVFLMTECQAESIFDDIISCDQL